MGKPDAEQPSPSSALPVQGTGAPAGERCRCCFSCGRLRDWVTLRCVLVMVLGCAVLLSSVFWLPFFHFRNQKALDLEYEGYSIVASFKLRKPASYLEQQKSQLREDIFNEIRFSSTEVQILSLKSSDGPNLTTAIFSVEADSTTQSLIRSSFTSLVTGQSSLHLTESLFGDPFSFEVLKFKGGLTVSPVQKAFLMQSVQISFNFTLNFSIDEILENFDQLSSQLKTGLHLAPYENLFISLTNLRGSTVVPPTKVVSEVLLAVGVNPSQSRIKQLAQTITGSHSKNLGLNNTVFGRVKQISLSSILQHSLGSDGTAPSPSPSSPPYLSENQHHHNHNHHHGSIPPPSLAPSPSHRGHDLGQGRPSFAPVPAPEHTKAAPPPLSCQFGGRRKSPGHHNPSFHVAPSASPFYPKRRESLSPSRSPNPIASPRSSDHGHGDSSSRSEYHPSRLSPIPAVSSLHSSSSMSAIFFFSSRWAFPLSISAALLFTAL